MYAACWSVRVITVSIDKSIKRWSQGLAFQDYVKKKEPEHFNTVSSNASKWQANLEEHGHELFSLTFDSDEKLAGLIIACVISGVVRDKMSPSVKYVLHTTLSNGWDNTRVVSGDDCWPGHCCKVFFSVCESFDVTGASFTERRTFNVCGERTVFVGIILWK